MFLEMVGEVMTSDKISYLFVDRKALQEFDSSFLFLNEDCSDLFTCNAKYE